MSLLNVSEVTKFYGKQDVLRGASFHVNAGDRVGLIGANGAGKTTLLRIILEQQSPDGGQVHKAKGLRLGYLPQDLMTFTGRTLINLVMDTAAEVKAIELELSEVESEVERASRDKDEEALLELTRRQSHLLERYDLLGGYTLETEAAKILAGLGFAEPDFHRPVEEFSGGWIMRAVLARLLLAGPDLLLLDEPTNHLDLDSLLWLEGYLKTCPGALLLVSHDRTFLNNVVRRIVEVERGLAHTYNGDYDRYLVEKEKRRATEKAAYLAQQERIKQVERFIERNRVRKDRAKQVQSRIKMLDKMDRLEDPVDTRRSFRFHLPDPSRPPDILVELSGLTKQYGRQTVYRNLDFTVRRGDRIAFLGANGRGKSTLLKLLAGLTDYQDGTRRVGEGVVMGYFAQFQLEELNPERTVLDELAVAAGDLGQGRLRSILGSFLFREEDVFKKTAVLSGGEKSRLVLARIMLSAPNLLLLDEPSNHLDIPGREMLETALREYPGAVCLISHDRSLINAVVDKVLVIKDGGVEVFPGDFDDYRRLWQEEAPEAPADAPARPRSDAGGETRARRDARKREEARVRQELHRRKAPLEKKAARLEEESAGLTARLDELGEQLADPAAYRDPEKIAALNREYAAVKADLDKAVAAWEEAALELEEIEEGGA